MKIVGQQGSLSCRFPPPKSRNIHCKFSDRLIFRQAEHMTKEPQLPKPDSFNKGSCFCKKTPQLEPRSGFIVRSHRVGKREKCTPTYTDVVWARSRKDKMMKLIN